MMHLGSLERTKEDRVALGYRLKQLLRIFRAPQISRVHHNSMEHTRQEPLLKFGEKVKHLVSVDKANVPFRKLGKRNSLRVSL